ncbi:MAG: hypothetical protein CL946_12160 [Ectothiorhodospiraceae bacterium]|nr:hypothetical protein [Ectothiorhodospiraceae bacterium]
MNTLNTLDSQMVTKAAKQLQLIFYALLATQIVVYVAFVFFVMPGREPGLSEHRSTLLIAIPAVNILAVLLANIIGRIALSKSDVSPDEKLKRIQGTYIARMALLEGVNVLNIVTYLLTQESMFHILFSVVLVLYAVTGYPTEERLKNALN